MKESLKKSNLKIYKKMVIKNFENKNFPLINISWLEMKPNENYHGNKEAYDSYINRISNKKSYEHIPELIFFQWIFPHYNNYNTLKNYAWIDFRKVCFYLINWEYNNFNEVYVTKDNIEYYEKRSEFDNVDRFCCTEDDLKYRKNYGTWRIPPIILDNKSIKDEIPSWSEIRGKYQLIEGHSRLGYLNSIKKYNKSIISSKHKVWIMTIK